MIRLRLRFYILTFSLTTAFGTIQAQVIDEISELQNARSLVDGRLYKFLSSPDSRTRERAVIALANIQDTNSISLLLPLLSDRDPKVRSAAAFAVGQIGTFRGAASLNLSVQHESFPACQEALVEALGKCGSRDDLRMLVSIAGTFQRDILPSVARSIARFAIRKITDSLATEFAASKIVDPLAGSAATYAFMRIADSSAGHRHLRELLLNMENSASETRMWTATILGNVKDTNASRSIVRHALEDKDWRVRVNSVRAMKNFSSVVARRLLFALLRDKDEHVELTAFSVMSAAPEKYASDSLSDQLVQILGARTMYSWRVRGEAAVLLARLLKNGSIGHIAQSLETDPMFRAKLIDALGETKSQQAIPLIQNELLDEDPRTASAAVAAYEEIVADKDSALQEEFCLHILTGLQRGDVSISYAIASALEDSSIRKSARAECIPQMVSSYEKLRSPGDAETMVEFLRFFGAMKASTAVPLLQNSLHDNNRVVAEAASNALKEITGKFYEGDVRPDSAIMKFYRPEDTLLVSRYHSALLSTSKGTIKIEFRPDAAPFTVLNFILLARRGFYDGLIFHRVVPNFVIQGGDPLGTGFGGPGYAIATEVHPDASFLEGAVGMASAGKDTEGSQFFITHCPTPHLDGRYTVVGYTRDMNVVNQIQVGDTIISVELDR